MTIQAVRLIGALAKAGIEVDTVCFGDMSKVPQNFLDDFKRLMPGVHLYDFAHEIHYDDNMGSEVSPPPILPAPPTAHTALTLTLTPTLTLPLTLTPNP